MPGQLGGLAIPLFSEKTCNELKDSLTITALLLALIITQGTNLPNAAKIKEAYKIITQRKTEQLTNLQRIHQRLKQTWIMIQKEQSVRQKNRVLLAG